MNNFWTKVLLVMSLSLSISRGASTINWDFGSIYVGVPDPGVNELADGMAVFLFVSKAGTVADMNGLATSLVGVDLDLASTFDSGDKVVIGISTPNFGSFGVAGTGNAASADITYSLGIDSGDALGLLFINQIDGVIVAGSEFGLYVSPTLTMPDDGSSVPRSFLEEQYGGTVTDNSLFTTHITLVPEPSSFILVMLGSLALLRRRR